MICELREGEYKRARALFKQPHARLVVDAVIAGNRFGRIWADDPERPTTAFMWGGSHRHYLSGRGDGCFGRELEQFIVESLVPEEKREGIVAFQLSVSPDIPEGMVDAMRKRWSLRKIPRVLYAAARCRSNVGEASIPPGFCISPIDRSLLNRIDLANLDSVVDEIEGEWKSIDNFLKKAGGFCVLKGEKVVCWCTIEYLSAAKCGFGIETVEEYQRHGLATCAAAACLEYALGRRLMPYWDSWEDNLGSIGVARRLGFEKVEDYSVYFGKT